MAVITGITGLITSWATGINAQLAGAGTTPSEATINMECEEFDTTAFDTTGAAAYIKGLKSWMVEFTAYLKIPDHGGGSNGLVTHTNGYSTNINRWTMDVTRDSFDSTVFADTVKTYAPGLIRWGGTYDGFMDDTTALIEAGSPSTDAAGLFKYQEKTTVDNTLTGTIFTTRASGRASPQALNSVSYTYRGTGDLTHSTPTTGAGIFPAGAVANTVAGSLVFTASTGRTFTGDAFWERVSISCAVGSLVTVNVTARGTGALVIA
jgi:hypothetical protein